MKPLNMLTVAYSILYSLVKKRNNRSTNARVTVKNKGTLC